MIRVEPFQPAKSDARKELAARGWLKFGLGISDGLSAQLRNSAFEKDAPGKRCLLDQPIVREAAFFLRAQLIESGFLLRAAVAIQAIAFDKTPSANWKVTWHQDVMFPFARPVSAPGFDLPTKKGGIDYARPPRPVLEKMLVVRLHLDDCDATSGPLRISPGSHRHGILKSTKIPYILEQCGEADCLAKTGEALLMSPLLLHASSPATIPTHRRVLHLVYHSSKPGIGRSSQGMFPWAFPEAALVRKFKGADRLFERSGRLLPL